MSGRFDRFRYRGEWRTLEVTLDPENVQTVCVLVEAYDNLAVVRTPRQGVGLLYMYYEEQRDAEVRTLVTEMSKMFPMTMGAVHQGMYDFGRVWNE